MKLHHMKKLFMARTEHALDSTRRRAEAFAQAALEPESIQALREFLILDPVQPGEGQASMLRGLIKDYRKGYLQNGPCARGRFNTHYGVTTKILFTQCHVAMMPVLGVSREELLHEWLRRDERVRTLRRAIIAGMRDEGLRDLMVLCDTGRGGEAKGIMDRLDRIGRSA